MPAYAWIGLIGHEFQQSTGTFSKKAPDVHFDDIYLKNIAVKVFYWKTSKSGNSAKVLILVYGLRRKKQKVGLKNGLENPAQTANSITSDRPTTIGFALDYTFQ